MLNNFNKHVTILSILLLPFMVVISVNADDHSRVRARELGIQVGILPAGTLNAITDVSGVMVGHKTLIEGADVRTGVTAVLPHDGNIYQEKVPAAMYVGNGYGKLAGYTQVEELGEIETPIVLTNTLSVGTAITATVNYTLNLPGNEQVRSVNAVVGETNDGYLNDIRGMHVTAEDVIEAINSAKSGPAEEGSIGAGTGTRAFGFKGGIGTSSRIVSPGGMRIYTVGVLVQSNYGGVLNINGAPVGVELEKLRRSEYTKSGGDGSCMIVIATDAPVSVRNLKRMARRAVLGLGRTGSEMSNGSGDYVIVFSTAYRIPQSDTKLLTIPPLLHNSDMTQMFRAVVEATQEAVYNSMFMAETMTGYMGHTVHAIDLADVIRICKRYGVIDSPDNLNIIPVAEGWAQNSVNAVIFRKDPIASFGDTQYIAFYGEDGSVKLGKRKLGSDDWEIRKTQYTGNTKDAHNTISIAVDGAGYLHIAWDHHGHPLRYCRNSQPGSLELTDKMPMTGIDESKVTYPEFFYLPDGGLLFLYRDGSSGNGRTMLNRYDVKTGQWSLVQHPLIDGMGERNAYTNQMAIDQNGGYHISWCWREEADVATNHDICYAKSTDGGKTWQKSTGEQYMLPITSDNAEIVRHIPQQSELINHTSMTVNSKGEPYIASYWRPEGTAVPQYFVVYRKNGKWLTSQICTRNTPFTLSGAGTKRIPISRPKILIDSSDRVYVLLRDEERGNRVSVALSEDITNAPWRIIDLSPGSVDLWEPSYDTALWQSRNILHLFVQKVGQGDAETLEDVPPQMVYVYEWEIK